MSKISVTTIAGLTSGGDANKVKIESGDTLQVESNATVGGTLLVGSTNAVGNASANELEITNSAGSGTVGMTFNVNSGSADTGNIFWRSNSSNNNIQIVGDPVTNYLAFATGGVERARFSSDGLHIGGTGAANALDDYEEGTFTPTLTPGGGSYNGLTLTGFYRKIGSVVHVIMRLNITASGDASGSMTVGSLPFTSANLSSGLRIPNVWRENAATGATGGFHINNNNTTGFLQDTSGSNIAHTTGRQYMINATYFSA